MSRKESEQKRLPHLNNKSTKINLMILETEQQRIIELQVKCRRPRRLFNQSEILRAGIYALEKLNPKQLEEVVAAVTQL